jgi:hypothetical protein
MAESPDEIRREIAQQRVRIDRDLHVLRWQVQERVSTVTDWPQRLRNHPVPVALAGLTLGLLLGWLAAA